VGEPLPKPPRELPSYGRSLLLALTGCFLVLVFLVQTLIAMFQRGFRSLGFWSWVAAGETAAWRLKWISVPVLFVTLWAGLKVYRSIREEPERFCGLNQARRGLIASAMVGLLIATLIGITIPARLRQREMAKDAAQAARGYAFARALDEYRLKFGTLPTTLSDLKKVSDPDGTLAAALRDLGDLDSFPGYKPSADVAAVSKQKSPRLRGAVIRNASLTSTDDATPVGISFTNYELRLPGEDKLFGTDDDWLVRDGIAFRVSDVAKGGVGRAVSAEVLKP
jgi:type II secretory pathway pseudopilin PulG